MAQYKKEIVTIDKDALDFLKAICFGAIDDPYEAASSRAYRDFSRTLRFNKIDDAIRKELRMRVTSILRERITAIDTYGAASQEDFDSWHKETCSLIMHPYNEIEISFSCGQAQKWLNMTIKYLYIIGNCSFDKVFGFLHIPVDNYVLEIARKELGVPVPSVRWSRWIDYEDEYMAYQKELRSRIKTYEPLRWEFKYWMKEAFDLTTRK